MPGPDVDAREDLEWLRHVARRLARAQDSDDVAHDTWLAAGPSPARSRSWWYGVLRNQWRMRVRSDVRRRNRERQAHAEPHEMGHLDPEQLATQLRVAEALAECLASLDPIDQRIVTLRHCEGWNASEIARELGLPPATIRTRLRRALSRMRRGLDERWGDESKQWQLAFAPTVGLAAEVGSGATATSITFGWAKWALAAVLVSSVGVAAAVGAFGAFGTSRDNAESSASLRSAAAEPKPAKGPTHAQTQWSTKLEGLKRARSRRWRTVRGSGAQPDAVDDAADALRGLFFEDAARSAAPLLRALGEQAAETLKECAQMHPSEAGALTVRAQLLGEPDVGTIVESVEIKKDTVGDPMLRECVQESAYTYDFPDPARSLYVAHDFTVDMDAKQVAAGAVLPLDHLPDVLERYPEFLDALPGVLEQVPAIRQPMKSLLDADPTLEERLPRFADILNDDGAASAP